jgi:hypothetical protein
MLRTLSLGVEVFYSQVGIVAESIVYRVERGIYLVRLGGYLSSPVSTELNEVVWRDHRGGRLAVLYETTAEFKGYDPLLRGTNRESRLLSALVHVGVVTNSAVLRMVVATIALGVRATLGIHMASYASVEVGVAGARAALSRGKDAA